MTGERTFPQRTRTCRSNRPSRAAIASGRLCPAGRNRKRNRRGETASINGDEGFVAADADFDKADFQLIFALERRCGQLDREAAKTLYAKVYESSEPAATSVATKDQEDFFTRRAEVLRAMLKSM
jgi:hypothetical protein